VRPGSSLRCPPPPRDSAPVKDHPVKLTPIMKMAVPLMFSGTAIFRKVPPAGLEPTTSGSGILRPPFASVRKASKSLAVSFRRVGLRPSSAGGSGTVSAPPSAYGSHADQPCRSSWAASQHAEGFRQQGWLSCSSTRGTHFAGVDVQELELACIEVPAVPLLAADRPGDFVP
jgi:hypothetical protein